MIIFNLVLSPSHHSGFDRLQLITVGDQNLDSGNAWELGYIILADRYIIFLQATSRS